MAHWGGVGAAHGMVQVNLLERSCESTESYGIAIGFVSTVFLCLQFTPQLYTSLLLRTAGSMSYLAYGLDVIGGIIILQARTHRISLPVGARSGGL
jgi:hypothetical protein